MPVIPASNQKLLVAAVALDVLGPDYRFRTELQSPRPVGTVVIPAACTWSAAATRCCAPPTCPTRSRTRPFNTTSLEPLADQLVAARDHHDRRRHRRRRQSLRRRVQGRRVGRRHHQRRRRPVRRAARQRRADLVGQLRARPESFGGAHVPRPARGAGDHRHRRRRQRRPAGRGRLHDAGVDRVAAADGRARRDAPHERQQHGRDDGQGDRLRGHRAGHASGRSRHDSFDARTVGGADGRPRPPRRLRAQPRQPRHVRGPDGDRAARSPVAAELTDLLPVAGRDGTLADAAARHRRPRGRCRPRPARSPTSRR